MLFIFKVLKLNVIIIEYGLCMKCLMCEKKLLGKIWDISVYVFKYRKEMKNC